MRENLYTVAVPEDKIKKLVEKVKNKEKKSLSLSIRMGPFGFGWLNRVRALRCQREEVLFLYFLGEKNIRANCLRGNLN